MKQTAVDYLYVEIWDKPKDKLVWYLIFMEAGAIYRNQIKEAYKAGTKDLEAKREDIAELKSEIYYNENYRKDA